MDVYNNKRLIALDVFRGMTIVLMLLVNNPGSWGHIYAPLRHAHWHGCTLTDLVFPFFMFIVGVSMGLSIHKNYTLPDNKYVLKSLKRGLIIFSIGYLMRLFPFNAIDIDHTRIMGVLQRIGLAFIIASIMINYLSKKYVVIASIIILFGYWLLLWWGNVDPYSLETNVVREMDLWLFGPDKLWHGTGVAFDPEGLLSTFPATVTIIIGYFISQIIIDQTPLMEKIKKMMIFGSVFLIIGKIWGIVFPINKALWTSSYVIYTAGWAMLTLAILLYIIDIKKKVRWATLFRAFGANPLFLFVLSGLFTKIILKLSWGSTNVYNGLYKNVFKPAFGELNGSLAFAISHIIIFSIIAIVLYRRKIFIKV